MAASALRCNPRPNDAEIDAAMVLPAAGLIQEFARRCISQPSGCRGARRISELSSGKPKDFIPATSALIFSAQCPGLLWKGSCRRFWSIMNSFVRIDANNVITMMANNSEFGNGAYTVMSGVIVELDVDYRSIALEACPNTTRRFLESI